MSAAVARIASAARPGRVARHGIRLAALAAIVVAGCGGDDPVSPPVGGRTIRFPRDAATIQAAVDMATRGDTVLVEAGAHAIDTTVVFRAANSGVSLVGRLESEVGKAAAERPVLDLGGTTSRSGIVLRSTAEDVTIRGLEIRGDSLTVGIEIFGPGHRLADCRIVGPSRWGVTCTQAGTTAVIQGNLFIEAGVFGVVCGDGADAHVIGNTIVGAGDCGIFSSDAAPVCERNIVVESANWGIACFGPDLPTLSCNALFDNVTADYSPECVPGPSDFHADPIFCDAITYAIASNSPCAPERSGACGLIGAVAVGCTPP